MYSILTNWVRLMALAFPPIIVYVIVKESGVENSLVPIGAGVLAAVVWGLLLPRILQ